MTTTPKGTHMPTDPNRALLRAVERLTTQVRRIADTLEPPVVVADLGGQTTGDDAQPLITRTIAHWGPVCEGGRHPAHALQTCDEIDAFTTFVQDRVQRLAVPDMQHVTTTMRENERLRTELAGATDAIERVRAIKPSPSRSEFNARTNAQDEGWDQALAAVRAALIGPLAEG